MGALSQRMGGAPEAAAELPCIIYHGSTITAAAFARSTNESIRWRPADELFARRGGTDAAVLITDASMLQQMSALRNIPSHIVIIAADVASETALGRRAHFSVAEFPDATSRGRVLRAACHLSCTRLTAMRRRRQLAHTNRELRELSRIGMALMVEHDGDTLLRDILVMGKQLTDSDGGVLFLVDAHDGAPPLLRLALHEFNSLPQIEPVDVTFPIDDTSIVGHAARDQKPVVIDDAYDLPADAVYREYASLIERYGYRRSSMLIVPMLDHLARSVGVLALVNRISNPRRRSPTRPPCRPVRAPVHESRVVSRGR